eukprot:3568836-Pyramimonas_sp.AAC.1
MNIPHPPTNHKSSIGIYRTHRPIALQGGYVCALDTLRGGGEELFLHLARGGRPSGPHLCHRDILDDAHDRRLYSLPQLRCHLGGIKSAPRRPQMYLMVGTFGVDRGCRSRIESRDCAKIWIDEVNTVTDSVKNIRQTYLSNVSWMSIRLVVINSVMICAILSACKSDSVSCVNCGLVKAVVNI